MFFIRLSSALLLGLSLSALPIYAQQTDTPAQLVKQGVALYDQGKYDEAVLRYKQALKQDPAHHTARYELAMTYNALGRNEEAVDLCRKLAKDDPEPGPSLYDTWGNALDGLHKAKEAVKVYQQGLHHYPNEGSLYYNLGVTQAASLGQLEESLASMQQAVRCRPTHLNSLNTLLQLTLKQGNRVPALLEMLRQLQLEPTGERATTTLARFDELVGQGVEKTGEQAVTINVSAESLKNAGKKGRPDNFGPADMLLSMSGALDYSEENKNKTPTEQLIRKLESLVGVLDELHPEKQPGFAWQYFVPYFVALKKQGYLPALAYSVQASRAAATPEVQQWLAAHTATLAEFRQWSDAYAWPK
ncbi:tetratricopeptide repeat protein [Hymenobacter rubripertinctus]|uniref:Tetratricopeptide repeat protein n=1 Tax=Hymenobacter rubripertinctus TaxID=2029981 RepID=A0A418QVL1_9BACT|nr:tetratricopeptide repeat protein [Hymenobacter rubripertinctus]RIY09237.1 tetratricopeptide repeat protein [Hymenobacter rubripertinctus]